MFKHLNDSCNRQIRSAELLVKDQDVTRSTVQKAVVVLASKPVFGPIRFVPIQPWLRRKSCADELTEIGWA
jgi:hypothetical protein